MKKILYAILTSFIVTSTAFANSDFIQKQYPKKSGACSIMGESTSDGYFCVSKVITKDFRKLGDNLYYIVLGKTELDGCHACSGIVDLYAISSRGKVITSKGINLGSWGNPPDEWKFTKRKDGKVIILTETFYMVGGDATHTKLSFSIKGDKFIHTSKSY